MSTAPTFTLKSPETGTEYRIFIEAPDETHEPGPWAPVLFTDGDDQFAAAVKAYHAARKVREVPALLLVGIGYGASYAKPANRRLRDYTPTMMATEQGSGGADAFLAFLVQTLVPELSRRYLLRAGAGGLAGHSLGSLLVLHALFLPRPAFTRFLASAPSLWWDDRALIGAAQRLQRTGVSLPAKVFLCSGVDDSPSMTGDLSLLEDQLAAAPFPELEVISRRFPGRDHYNVLPDAFRAGLGALFGSPRPEK
jgi:predicted alpha/beta superfamily hydrolase